MRRRSLLSALVSACACAAIFLGALSAEANVQSNRWFYEVSNEDRDIHLVIQLIEEDPPSFDTTFKLTRGDETGVVTLFEHRQFAKEEADEVFGPGCVEDWSEADYFNADCDSDGTDDCAGTCGTAYRYDFVDECVPDSAETYRLYDEATTDQVGEYVYEFESDDDSCLGTDDDGGPGGSGCSVAGAPGRSSEAALAALMLLVGIGFVVVARRMKSR